MMASVVKLPFDILQAICSKLAPRDIINFCRSCSGMHWTIVPLQLRHITLSWDVEAAPDRPPNVSSLLLFILRNPSYAKHIKRVDIDLDYRVFCLQSEKWREQGFQSPLSLHRHGYGNETALVRDVLGELCLPDPEQWLEAVVEKSSLGAIVALILAQCTHLESLKLNLEFLEPSMDYNLWFPVLMKHAVTTHEGAPRLSRFHNLSSLALSNPNKDFPSNIMLPKDFCLLPFYMPKMTTISLAVAPNFAKRWVWESSPPYTLKEPFWPLPEAPRAANLTTLHLGCTSAPASTVELLLRHTPSLRSLVYNCELQVSSWPAHLNAYELRQGLEHVRDTLTHLVLRFVTHDDPDAYIRVAHMSPMVVAASLGSLGSLTALERLDIPLGLLYGQQVAPSDAAPLADVLPARLKHLTMNDDLWDYEVFQQWRGEPTKALLMAFFAGPWRTATPWLKDFVLDRRQKIQWSREYWSQRSNGEELRKLVESQDIRCSIHGD